MSVQRCCRFLSTILLISSMKTCVKMPRHETIAVSLHYLDIVLYLILLRSERAYHGPDQSTVSRSRPYAEDSFYWSVFLGCFVAFLSDGSSELTNEIRGERLRFVDAMKEATEINVQGKRLLLRDWLYHKLIKDLAHVEQFKKELTREVLAMTQDVGRLHKERQAIEQQIADLFAFYSKQKQKQSGSVSVCFPITTWQAIEVSFFFYLKRILHVGVHHILSVNASRIWQHHLPITVHSRSADHCPNHWIRGINKLGCISCVILGIEIIVSIANMVVVYIKIISLIKIVCNWWFHGVIPEIFLFSKNAWMTVGVYDWLWDRFNDDAYGEGGTMLIVGTSSTMV